MTWCDSIRAHQVDSFNICDSLYFSRVCHNTIFTNYVAKKLNRFFQEMETILVLKVLNLRLNVVTFWKIFQSNTWINVCELSISSQYQHNVCGVYNFYRYPTIAP